MMINQNQGKISDDSFSVQPISLTGKGDKTTATTSLFDEESGTNENTSIAIQTGYRNVGPKWKVHYWLYATTAVFAALLLLHMISVAPTETLSSRRGLQVLTGKKCFSPQSTIELEGGGIKTMQDLRIGDKIMVSRNKYQHVYAFARKLLPQDSEEKHEYIKITPDFNNGKHSHHSTNTMELTPDHLIYRHGEDTPVPASMIKETDTVTDSKGEPVNILKLETVYRYGAYVPLTVDGTVVVGGIKASSYVSYQDGHKNVIVGGLDTFISWHGMVHKFMKPLTVYCTVLSRNGVCEDEAYMEDGKNLFSTFGSKMVRLVWGMKNPLLQAVSFAFAFSFVLWVYVTVYILENYIALATVSFAMLLFVSVKKPMDHRYVKLGKIHLKMKSA